MQNICAIGKVLDNCSCCSGVPCNCICIALFSICGSTFTINNLCFAQVSGSVLAGQSQNSIFQFFTVSRECFLGNCYISCCIVNHSDDITRLCIFSVDFCQFSVFDCESHFTCNLIAIRSCDFFQCVSTIFQVLDVGIGFVGRYPCKYGIIFL